MKKILSFIAVNIAALCCFLTAAGQQNNDIQHSLLWRVSGKGIAKPSYLFGTIHIICGKDYIWTRAMSSALLKTDKICMEMDLDDPSLTTQLLMKMLDTSGKTLSDYFTEEQYEMIARYIKEKLHQDVNLLRQMKPVMLEMLFSSVPDNCTDPVSYELKLLDMARVQHKEIIGLETVDEQLQALNAIPIDSVLKDILEIASGNKQEHGDAAFEQLVNTYKQQDLDALSKLISSSKELSTGLNALLDDRNRKWIPQMMAMMKRNAVFFAVGAGHLGGEQGVIRLLRKEGYKVEAVR